MIDLKYTQEQLLFNTIRIGIEGDEKRSMGTGFIVKYRLPYDKKKFYTFIVSCKHVIEDPKDSIDLVFHKLDKSSTEERPLIKEWTRVNFPKYDGAYFKHPDEDVDLACIQVSKIIEDLKSINSDVYFLAVEPEHFANFDEEGLLPGTPLFFIGYPSDIYDKKHNLPLFRHGYIASAPKVDYLGKPEFVIDAECHPGSSGSPVYAYFGKRIHLVGVLTAMFFAPETIDVNGEEIEIRQRIGLGKVIKVHQLKELLDGAFEQCESMLGRKK